MKLDLLDIYTDYLISQNQQATVTGLSNLLDGQISHDKIIRFLNNNPGGSKEFWQYVKKQVRHLEQDKVGKLFPTACKSGANTKEKWWRKNLGNTYGK
ncbi:hypothetical protein DB41_GC00310 [Neochlamydia sp. TUME1]|nr:hypothetical protein [Neochlamydia sp. TUME1]KIC76464.1 hypothetical protein DB41_GC00310 [Neochlamydia sp. TUME1]